MEYGDRLLVRLIQVSAVILVIGLALAAAVLAWVAVELHGLSGDISQSRSQLPVPVKQVLPQENGVLDNPQVTLVRYTKGIAYGSAVLFSTVPDRNLAGFLTVPATTTVGNTQLWKLTVTQAIQQLRADGIRVDHVALIDPDHIGELVDGLGGITVNNRIAFATQNAAGATIRFPTGPLKMNGDDADLYVQAATSRNKLEDLSSSVLAGIVQKLLAPAGLDKLRDIGGVLAKSTSTDLSDADVLGLVDLRLRGGTALQCRLPRETPLTTEHNQSAIGQFLGTTSTLGAPCAVHHLDAAPLTPPVTVVKIVQHYGWHLFVLASAVLAALAVAATVFLVMRWPRLRAPEQEGGGALPPLSPSGSS
jgi:hypothetical protein